MKSVTIMQAQHNLSKVLRSIPSAGRIRITRNKRVVAELVMPSEQQPPDFPDFTGRARKTWGRQWEGASSDELLDEARGDR